MLLFTFGGHWLVYKWIDSATLLSNNTFDFSKAKAATTVYSRCDLLPNDGSNVKGAIFLTQKPNEKIIISY